MQDVRIDISGRIFGHLTALRFIGGKTCKWECSCVCGKVIQAQGGHLRHGHTTSCGCRNGHGHASRRRESPTYKTWQSMISRCEIPTHAAFARYGGRGISVCKRWRDFKLFLSDMGERPVDLTLDRINNDGNYEPGNCRWATRLEQARNKSGTVRLEWRGVRATLAEHVQAAGMRYSTVRRRLSKGWTLNEALRMPPGGTGKAGG